MKPSRAICRTGKETSMRRRVGIVTFILVAGAVALAAAMVGRVTAQDWRTASQQPVGLAPDPSAHGEAIVQVYAARVIGWRGVFGVHTWIAVKPAAANEYTVYEIIGWRLRSQDTALVVRPRAPDMRWVGSAPSGRGFQVSFFGLAGLTASAVEGFEVNLLGLSFGINPFDPSLKLPLIGRVGPARAFASKADETAAEKHAL